MKSAVLSFGLPFVNSSELYLTTSQWKATDLTPTQLEVVRYVYGTRGGDHLTVDSENNLLGIVDGGNGGDLLAILDQRGAGAFDFAPSLYGGRGSDTLLGGHGGDDLEGYSGADVIQGNAGADYIFGGTGDDTMTGGSGSDTFKFLAEYGGTAELPTTIGDMGRDVITDFDARGQNHDKISLGATGLTFADMQIYRHGGGVVVDGATTLHLGDGTDLFVHIHVMLEAVNLRDVTVDVFN